MKPIILTIVLAALAGTAWAQQQPAADAQAAASAPSQAVQASLDPAAVGFDSDQTIIWLGASAVLPFHVKAPADVDRVGELHVEDDGIVRILRRPEVLAGHAVGYVRLQPQREGQTVLRLGEASLTVQVQRSPAHEVMRTHRPRIFTPVEGAAIWGKVAVGVDLFDDPVQVASAAAAEPRQVWLELPDGQRIDPVEQQAASAGPIRQVVFEVDTANLKPGMVDLMAVAATADGKTTRSRPLALRVLSGDSRPIVDAEAEQFADAPRPERYGEGTLKMADAEHASAGRYVVNNSSRPTLSIPIQAEEPGWYQCIALAQGDPGGGVLPTVGVRVDENDRASTASRVPAVVATISDKNTWRRTAIGRPVHLGKGEHTLMLYFENDFSAGRGNDRNLRIDRVEIMRIEQNLTEDRMLRDGERMDLLRVAFEPDLQDDQTIGGDLLVKARCNWNDDLQPQAPRTTLLVNGKPLASQQFARPRFDLPFAALRDGENTLQLEAQLANGVTRRSIPISINALPNPGRDGDGRPTLRYHVSDPLWREIGNLDHERRHGPDRFKSLYSNAALTLSLPDDLSGRYEVWIDSRGDHFDGPPLAAMSLTAGDVLTPVGEIKAPHNNFNQQRAGNIELLPGSKRITVTFTNDKHEPDKGDRNLFVRAIELRPIHAKDEFAPTAKLLYPEPGTRIDAVDAVIVETSDNRNLDWVELVIDGQLTGVRENIRDSGRGRTLLPLIARRLEPGEHRVAVRARDRSGNVADSEERVVYIAGSDEKQALTRYQRAVRLLDRFAFGPDPNQLMVVLLEGERAYLDRQLTATLQSPAEDAAWQWALTEYPNDRNGGEVARRAIDYALVTPNPVRARLVLFMDNHFNTWQRKTGSERKAAEFERFVQLGAAPFEDLLLASATSPAMLHYLDQNNSYGKRLNENYAREIMELHTVGVHAGYTQQDVTEMANLLTGWRSDSTAREDGGGGYLDYTFVFDPALHDLNARSVFGLHFEKTTPQQSYDRVRTAIEMLARHPETARYLATKLAEHYAEAPAPDDLVDQLAEVFIRTGGDMRHMILTLADHPATCGEPMQPRFMHPIDFALRMQRCLGAANAGRVAGFLSQSGFGMFDRETPDGYPEEDIAYADSNAMLQRWKLAQQSLWDLNRNLPDPLRRPPAEPEQREAWREKVVDVIAVKLTGRTFSDRSRSAAMEMLAKVEDKGDNAIREALVLIAQLPETSMR